ncbi:MAG: AraC family transcriptional regulator ligand-binding domain-containing protein [Cyanobacteria bacterium P01_H01_bin.119]
MNFEKDIGDINHTKSTSLMSLATSIITFAISKGMTPDELDVSQVDFIDQNARITDHALSNLIDRVTNKWPDTPISMEIARSAPISMLGGLAQGSRFAPNVESVLAWWAKSQWIVADQVMSRIEKTASEIALVIAHPCDGYDKGVAMETAVGVHWRLLNAITDFDVPLTRVEFTYEKPLPLQAYESFFQAPVLFQTGRNALVFPRESLGIPIRLANPQMFELIDHQFAMLRQKRNRNRYPTALASLHQSTAENAARGEYRAAAVAAAAKLSLRSAQRLAAQHNTSLQQLIDEVRLANAKNFLNDPEITIEGVSPRIGYADVRSFRRAFKRWTGLTPTTYRKL